MENSYRFMEASWILAGSNIDANRITSRIWRRQRLPGYYQVYRGGTGGRKGKARDGGRLAPAYGLSSSRRKVISTASAARLWRGGWGECRRVPSAAAASRMPTWTPEFPAASAISDNVPNSPPTA